MPALVAMGLYVPTCGEYVGESGSVSGMVGAISKLARIVIFQYTVLQYSILSTRSRPARKEKTQQVNNWRLITMYTYNF
jgi:hypothetical protein